MKSTFVTFDWKIILSFPNPTALRKTLMEDLVCWLSCLGSNFRGKIDFLYLLWLLDKTAYGAGFCS